MQAIIHLLSDTRGVYIPRDFLTDNYGDIAEEHCSAWGLTEDNKLQWESAINPNDEWYWESWEWILNNAEYIAENGDKYNLYQDGDLWAICYDKMTEEEKRNFGFDE